MHANGAQKEENPFILYPIKIAGVGAYLPKRVVYNEDIEQRGGFQFTDAQKSKMGVVSLAKPNECVLHYP